MVIFTMVLGAVLLSQFAGMRMVEKTRLGLDSRDDVQKLMNALAPDVRGAKWLAVGTWNNNVFTGTSPNSAQQGNAVRMVLSTNTNFWVQYFRDASDRSVKRQTNGGNPVVLLPGVTNSVVFWEEDHRGILLSNGLGSFTLAVDLRFDPTTNLMGQVQHRLTRRSPE